jgi:hypothetical protein
MKRLLPVVLLLATAAVAGYGFIGFKVELLLW